MADAQALTLATAGDAAAITEYFNGFHDGFIRSLAIRSRDRFTVYGPAVTDIGHQTTGAFDVDVEFAHYNYAAGSQPADRIVEAVFSDVAAIRLELDRIKAEEWPLTVVEFPQLDARFALDVTWGLWDGVTWSTQQYRLFTFATARFRER